MLAADLAGSTGLAEAHDPEHRGALLERFLEEMRAEIDEAGGRVETVVGDALTAAFGAPVAQEGHAERALHAALAMRRRLDQRFGDVLSLRIGVDTGEVVVGRARPGSSSLTGGAVTAAARLGQAAGPGTILVGDRTAATTRGAFEFGPPTVVEAQGGREGLSCRPLVRALSLTRTHGSGGLRSAFVGREIELEVLRSTHRRAVEEGQAHLVTVTGDAGVERHGSCASFGTGSPRRHRNRCAGRDAASPTAEASPTGRSRRC